MAAEAYLIHSNSVIVGMGGFSGQDRAPTVATLAQSVTHGQLRFVLANGRGSGSQSSGGHDLPGGASRGGASTRRTQWVSNIAPLSALAPTAAPCRPEAPRPGPSIAAMSFTTGRLAENRLCQCVGLRTGLCHCPCRLERRVAARRGATAGNKLVKVAGCGTSVRDLPTSPWDKVTSKTQILDRVLLLARLDQERALDITDVDLVLLAADAVHDAKAREPNRPVTLIPGNALGVTVRAPRGTQGRHCRYSLWRSRTSANQGESGMTIRSAAKHRKSRPARGVPVGSRRWVGMLVPVLAVVTAATVAGGVSTAVAADNPNPTVIVGGDPQGVAVDPDGKHAYVTSFADNALRVLDLNTANPRLVGSIKVGANPRGVAVDPDSRHALVTNYAENSVSVVDTAAGKVIGRVPVGANPTAVAIFPRDHYAFVTNFYGNTVSVINTANLKVVGTVLVGSHPDGVAIDPKGQFAYVANSGGNTISIIDVHTQKLVRAVTVGPAPQKVAIDPDGKHAYVTNFGDNSLSVIDLPTQFAGLDLYSAALPSLKVNKAIPVGMNPRGLAVSRDSHHVFVVNTGQDTMTVIDPSTGGVITTAFVGFAPDEVAVAPNDTAYVTARGDGTVTVIRPS